LLTDVLPFVNHSLTLGANSRGRKNLIEMFSFWSHKEQEANIDSIAARARV
jgi:hypothetical protein